MHDRATFAEAARAVAETERPARVEFVTPFVEAAAHVVQQECGETVTRGKLYRVRSPQTSNDVSILIAITGKVAGLVVYSMSQATGAGFASRMIGEPVAGLEDPMAQSALAELANIITGQAGIALERNGYPSDMSPPVLLLGHGSSIATFNLTRLVVPLVCSFGEFSIDIAIKEA
ncbi:MAG: chemotaxis protein CheX [Hyphomicrobiales bacterium]